MDFSKVSPTAETISYLRDTNLIPYGPEFANYCNAETVTKAFYHQKNFDVDLERMKKMQWWSALRFHALATAIQRSYTRGVLELGAGFSPLGLWTLTRERNRFSDLEYLETDLKPVISQKQRMTCALSRCPEWGHHHFAPVDALSKKQMLSAVKRFLPPSLIVVHEGLLQYFTNQEKLTIAKNVRTVLEWGYGMYATTDIVLKKHLKTAFDSDAYNRKIHEIMTENTGRDMVECAFESFDEAEALYREAGFTVKRHTQLAYADFPVDQDMVRVHKNLEHQQLWTMTPR